jgi:hypothetical protein
MPHGIPDSALNVANLRLFLGEPIPSGGDEGDTLFTDAQLSELIADTGGWEGALADGWKMKAAAYAGLVDSAEGTSKRALSDLHGHALEMVKAYGSGGISSVQHTVIHPIVRR